MILHKAKKFVPSPIRMIKNRLISRLNPIPKRYGKGFMEAFQFVSESQWWSEDEMTKYQNEQLKAILEHAYNNVPYYTKVFRNIGFHPEDFRTLEDLSLLPTITKRTVVENYNAFIASNYKKYNPVELHTSGTTGRPFRFLVDKHSIDLELALTWRHWNWIGYYFGEKRATFRQYLYASSNNSKKYQYDPIENNFSLFSYRTSPELFELYFSIITKYKPRFIRGYPSFIWSFAKFLKKNRKSIDFVDSIVCSSEMLYEPQKHDIEDVFGCQVYNWYGCGENIANACECQMREGFHINEERGILEFSQDKNKGNNSEIIATGLSNFAMPLIRYRVKDRAILSNTKCSCGRKAKLISTIKGRESDIIIGKDGKEYYPAGIIDLVSDVNHIEDSQLIQMGLDQFTLKIVREEKFGHPEEKQLLYNMENIFGNADINIEFVDYIDKTGSGKYMWFISKLNNSEKN